MTDRLEEVLELLGPAAHIPIAHYLETVAESDRLPVSAIAICVIRIEEAAPTLRTLLARAVLGESLTESEALLLFRGLHILGGARDTRTFKPLMLLLRRSTEELDELLGDAITETLSKITVGVFDGDSDALLAAIVDSRIDEFARDALFGAAAFLAWNGQIDRDRLQQFLVRFYEERLAEDGDHAWVGWQETIALLGLRTLQPIVHQAFRDGRIAADVLSSEDFDSDLDAAENAPDDVARFQSAGTGYIEDVVTALEWTDRFYETFDDETVDNDGEGSWDDEWGALATPIVNPLRAVGRNDPCPCGSGKKFKKCCLAI
jgi:hypothetical protein